jgi:hypothetical protein
MMLPGIMTIGFPIASCSKLVYGDNNQLIAEMGGYMVLYQVYYGLFFKIIQVVRDNEACTKNA